MDEPQRPSGGAGREAPDRRHAAPGSTAPAFQRLALEAARAGLRDALAAYPRLLSFMALSALLTGLLGRFGLIDALSSLADGPLAPFGLPGKALLVLVAAAFLDLYAALAVGAVLFLDLREATILAVMCLAAHDLPRETRAMRRSGSSGTKMILLRFAGAAIVGWALDFLLPSRLSRSPLSLGLLALPSAGELLPALGAWAPRAGLLLAAAAAFVLVLGVVERLFAAFRGVELLARFSAPAMRFFGLPRRDAALFASANALGYGYAAGLAAAEIEDGRIKQRDGDLFNHHAAASHSLIEETLLLAFAGLPVFWLLVPRLAGAAVLVWAERARRHYFRRSFRAGIG